MLRYESAICPYCTSGCGMYLVVKDGRIVGRESRKDYPLNEGKVLPAAAWVERERTHTGVDRRVVKIDKIVDPPGEARPDWWIIIELAKAMGHAPHFDYASAGEAFQEIRRCVRQYAGISYERLERCPVAIHWPCPSEAHPGTPAMFAESFGSPDGKGFRGACGQVLPVLPDGGLHQVLRLPRRLSAVPLQTLRAGAGCP